MLIGRTKEKQELQSLLQSGYSEFVAVYGRRRVGKTFLIRETFDYTFTFQHTGMANATTAQQLEHFRNSLLLQGAKKVGKLRTWLQAFVALQQFLLASTDSKKLVFIDELPWLNTPKSDFVSALEAFWNGWPTSRRDIVLIVCGSATSWIVEKIVNNHGGLHNRLTKRIQLHPFTLKECEAFSCSKNLALSRHQLVEAYMVLGGIPYYWNFLKKGLSVAQNIGQLFFAFNGELRNEFDMLYASLFRHPEGYIKVVEALSMRKVGMSRTEIIRASGLSDNGSLSQILNELEWCGFIRKYTAFDKKSRGVIFQQIDNYTLFYYRFFLQNTHQDENFWTHVQNSPLYNTWAGLAFERVCLQHVAAIKQALGISGVQSNIHAWHQKADVDKGIAGAQIDLVIDRADNVVNLCEMKFSKTKFTISSEYTKKLQQKVVTFQAATQSPKSLHLTMVTSNGVLQNASSDVAQSYVTLDDLFFC